MKYFNTQSDSSLILFTFIQLLRLSVSIQFGNIDVIERFEILEPNGGYQVGWKYFPGNESIIFEVIVQTMGFVGFGISPVGGMTGADIVIGGVDSETGTPYFTDRHGVGNSLPIQDEIQNWDLISATENGTHTHLIFSRLLNTCDENDVAITNGTTNFIWSMGSSDSISYHGSNRGTYGVNILDPPMPPFDSSKFKSWKMLVDMEMPKEDTTYWCTVHKSPKMQNKHHIVGFRPVFETPEALKHSHHFIIHSCTPPEGSTAEEAFEKYISTPGGKCYQSNEDVVPEEHCQAYLFVWAVGGKIMLVYPVNENNKANYYMLEVHYNNPDELNGVSFSTGLEIFYTDELREEDAGTLTVGHNTIWTITVPPNSPDYMIVGHCSPSCSSNIPSGGINVFNVLLHSHLSGRKLKIRHFRGNKELPWLASDDNYNFDYQQNRPLGEEVNILPGDHLIYECNYDSSWKTNKSVIGGLSTTEEMCNTFLWYYPKIPLIKCTSEFPQAQLMKGLGIDSLTGKWDPIITSPPNMAGKHYTEVLDTMIPWTPANRTLIQEQLRFGSHSNKCVVEGKQGNVIHKDGNIFVTYPEVEEEYQPPNHCQTTIRR